jgi:membrane peptidoglycan carboxypeptidase
MSFARTFKWIAAACVVAIVSLVGYSAWVIHSARGYTISTVLPQTRAARFYLAPADLTPRQLEILLNVEDPNFFSHHGVDFSTPGAGITTITQGLVKFLYFKKFKPGFAKLKQTLIAVYALDPLMPKEEQLRLFLNRVYLGHGVRGFAPASRLYFGKPFKDLTEDQYIALVAMIIAPEVFDLQRFPARNAERVVRIKRLVRGAYQPRGLFDVYYGKIDAAAQKHLPPLSYFASYYE